MKTKKRVLLVATRRIGDVLLTTPLIRSLRHAWPDARIDVLVFSGTEGVLSGNPDIDRVLTIAPRPKFFEHLRFMVGLWRTYDIAVSTMSSDRPTLYAILAAKFSVGEVDEGNKHRWKRRLLSKYAQSDNLNTHTVLMHLKLADLLEIPRCHDMVMAWRPEDEAAVHKALPFDMDTQTYAVLHVSPMYVYKAWRREAWVELAHWMHQQGLRVVLTGGAAAGELAYAAKLQESLPQDTVSVAGKIGLSGVGYLLSRARAYVGPDTVVTHLAAAVGTPTVALFGPSNPVKWGPWPKGYEKDSNPFVMRGSQRVNNVFLLQGVDDRDCVPCFEEGCDRHINSLSACLQNLPAAKVIAALNELANQNP